MLMLILTWIGAVLGLSLLLIMALGPVIVEIDAKLYERKHEQRRARARMAAWSTSSTTSPRSTASASITAKPATDH
jgi:hypothetical protein